MPINCAFQHPYYLGRGAAAIVSSERHYYLMSSYDRTELEDDVLRLAVAARAEHALNLWKYYFTILRIYAKIDVDRANPVLGSAIERLNNKGERNFNLDDLLGEPPQSHSKP